jgi:predicted dehydrogenase
MNEISIGLAGFGYWGSKLARNIQEASGCRLTTICEPDDERREACLRRYPGCRGVRTIDELVTAGDVDAVMLATPASSHAQHALAAIRAGKHAFVEKPLALTSADCSLVCREAEDARVTLMVGHTFLYSDPVRYLRGLIESGELGHILYVYGQRLNLGVIRDDLNALWNFGPHDISILLYLLGDRPRQVSARQFSVLEHRLEDVAFMVLEFESGVVGHIHTSWLDPRKVRQFTVVGSSKMAVYDDTDVELPILIYDKGVRTLPLEPGSESFREFEPDNPEGFGEFKLQTRAGDVVAPRVEGREPLRVEVEHFVSCVANEESPLTNGEHGRQVVAILEAAERSARDGGARVDVEEHLAAGRALR